MSAATYWNGEPTPAAQGTAVIAKPADVAGQRIEVVWVSYHGETFYLDDRTGSGWRKVTNGFGSPRYGHRSVVIKSGSFLTETRVCPCGKCPA